MRDRSIRVVLFALVALASPLRAQDRVITLEKNGNLFVSDTGNHTIRQITPAGVVTTVAGLAGQSGLTDATGSAARFNSPLGIAISTNGTIYVADCGNHLIRAISPGGSV